MIAQPSESATIQPTTLETIQTHLHRLAPEQQQQVLDFVDFLAQRTQPQTSEKSLWDVLDEVADSIPIEERDKMPTDGSYQHDHYLYGTPKREL